ncbi:ABC-three component system middle component 1 [Sporomusa acidovorans]|uniref:ABC-three component system middle component 1 n=1 Tax=Sporomusa acidovorans TaxID=112900 RepID=UPI00088D4831|nr:ABC-three component system middle component 1 [Sporomusa acidovorans]OZC19003.1 hypothetical protein SPACI_30890 [Sporomusa acidovorans DSM 3132]SDD72728.1 hypothetical protein SAMN04488499_1003177 [Sporomusa acidovorans]
MIGIIKTILCENDFIFGQAFTIEAYEQSFEIQSLISRQNPSQVFLLFPILESKLLEINLLDTLPNIAASFKETTQYEPEMEKNTSLVICVNRDVDSIKLVREAIAIEDNPYYFKKYLFAYHNSDAKSFEQLKKEYNCENNTEFIQKYVINSTNFTAFKDNPANAETYKMVSDLLVKLPVISIAFSKTEKILSVQDFFQEEEIQNRKEKLDRVIDIVNADSKISNEQLAEQLMQLWDEAE